MAAGLLFTVTLTPSRLSGSFPLMISVSGFQILALVERFVPKTVDHEPDSMPGWKLAPFTTAVIAGGPVIGKFMAFETLPSGFEMVIVTAPPLAIKMAAMLAVRLVELPNVVGHAVLPKFVLDPETKPVPAMVNCTPGDPAATEVGETLEIARLLKMEKLTAPETLPSGLVTVTMAVPTEVRRFAGIVAVSDVALPKTVGRLVVLQLTTEPETNPEPVMVTCWLDDPTMALAGEILEMTGFGGPAAFAVKA